MYSGFRIKDQANVKHVNLQTCAPSNTVPYEDIPQGADSQCGSTLLSAFSVMKDKDTCDDPLAISQKTASGVLAGASPRSFVL